jgi:hypothetical protein
MDYRCIVRPDAIGLVRSFASRIAAYIFDYIEKRDREAPHSRGRPYSGRLLPYSGVQRGGERAI